MHEAIEKIRLSHPFEIDAWVLLPDHLHCLWTLPDGDADFSKRCGKIKRLVSLVCGDRYKRMKWMSDSKNKHREPTIWQRRYWEHQIRDQKDLNRHVDYIHYNPVKHCHSGQSPLKFFLQTLDRALPALPLRAVAVKRSRTRR